MLRPYCFDKTMPSYLYYLRSFFGIMAQVGVKIFAESIKFPFIQFIKLLSCIKRNLCHCKPDKLSGLSNSQKFKTIKAMKKFLLKKCILSPKRGELYRNRKKFIFFAESAWSWLCTKIGPKGWNNEGRNGKKKPRFRFHRTKLTEPSSLSL